MSVLQFLEAEKRIRVKSLVKFSNLSMAEIKTVFKKPSDEEIRVINENAECLLLMADGLYEHQMDSGDEASVYFVSGYFSRSQMKKTSCKDCHELLAKNTNMPNIEIDIPSNSENNEMQKESFLKHVSRGGLVTPSDLMFMVCAHA